MSKRARSDTDHKQSKKAVKKALVTPIYVQPVPYGNVPEKKFLDAYCCKKLWSSSTGVFDPLMFMSPEGVVVDGVAVAGGVINAPPQNNGPNGRNGRAVSALSIQIDGIINVASAEILDASFWPVPSRTVFLALVLDKESNGALPPTDGIWINPLANSAAVPPALGQGKADGLTMPLRNLAFNNRYEILAVKRLKLIPFTEKPITAPAAAMSYGYEPCHFRFYRKLDFQVQFKVNTATAAISDVLANAVHLVAMESFPEGGNAGNHAAVLSYVSRFRFSG